MCKISLFLDGLSALLTNNQIKMNFYINNEDVGGSLINVFELND